MIQSDRWCARWRQCFAAILRNASDHAHPSIKMENLKGKSKLIFANNNNNNYWLVKKCRHLIVNVPNKTPLKINIIKVVHALFLSSEKKRWLVCIK